MKEKKDFGEEIIRNEDILNLLLNEIKKGATTDKIQDMIQKMLWFISEKRMVELASMFGLEIKVQ